MPRKRKEPSLVKQVENYGEILPYTKEYDDTIQAYIFKWYDRSTLTSKFHADKLVRTEAVIASIPHTYDPVCRLSLNTGKPIVIFDPVVIEDLAHLHDFLPNKFNVLEDNVKQLFPVYCNRPRHRIITFADQCDLEMYSYYKSGKLPEEYNKEQFINAIIERVEKRKEMLRKEIEEFKPIKGVQFKTKVCVVKIKFAKGKVCHRVCQICGEIFESDRGSLSRNKKVYCSKACSNKARTDVDQQSLCRYCGTEYTCINVEDFCSHECEEAQSDLNNQLNSQLKYN